jgi:hypothetical protein
MYELSVYPIAYGLWRWQIFASDLVHSAEGPSTDWALATLLIAAVGVLLLLGKIGGDRHPATSTAAKTKGAVWGLYQDRYQTRA